MLLARRKIGEKINFKIISLHSTEPEIFVKNDSVNVNKNKCNNFH